jgi:multiple sugar transport system permease protein
MATRTWRRRIAVTPFVLLAPGFLLFCLFVLYPVAASIRLSLYDWDGLGAKTWVGFGNYGELLADPVFYKAVANNLRWAALNMLAPVFGLALALFLNQSVVGIRLVRSLFFLPFVISQVVVGLVFTWFFNTQLGLLNQLLAWVGLGPAAMLDSERWAIIAVIIAGLWPQIAYCMILYLAGLTAVKPEQIDAARVDGARGLTLLRHVVLPQLGGVTFIAAMVSVVSALRNFDLVMIMTAGGPYDSSNVLAYYMYEQTFLGFRFGYGAAIATVLLLLMGAPVGYFLWRLLQGEKR